MEVVQYEKGSFLTRVLPSHRASLLSAIIYQLHKFEVGTPQHELAVTSLEDRYLVHPTVHDHLTDDERFELLADLLFHRIDVYVESGPVLVFRNTHSCRGTIRVVRRTSRKATRRTAPTHYDAFLHRIKETYPKCSTSTTVRQTFNTIL